VRIRIDRDSGTRLHRAADQRVGKVEVLGLRVDLQNRSRAESDRRAVRDAAFVLAENSKEVADSNSVRMVW
jgi:hypothetical protein